MGCGSFFGGGSRFCVGHHLCSFWGVCCHFWAVVSGRLQWWSVGIDVVAGQSLVIIGGVVGVVVVVVVVVGDERRPRHMVFGWWFVW